MRLAIFPLSILALSLSACDQSPEQADGADTTPAAVQPTAAPSPQDSAQPTSPIDTAAPAGIPSAAPSGSPAQTPAGFVAATLTGLSCGDNCYLEYRTGDSAEVKSALCLADGCGAWQQGGELPAAYRGRDVFLKLGTGRQYDAAGNVMSEDYPAVTVIQGI